MYVSHGLMKLRIVLREADRLGSREFHNSEFGAGSGKETS